MKDALQHEPSRFCGDPHAQDIGTVYNTTVESSTNPNGSIVVTSTNSDGSINTYSRSDLLIVNGGYPKTSCSDANYPAHWCGGFTGNYQRTYYKKGQPGYSPRYGGRCGCLPYYIDSELSGSGTLQQTGN